MGPGLDAALSISKLNQQIRWNLLSTDMLQEFPLLRQKSLVVLFIRGENKMTHVQLLNGRKHDQLKAT